MNGQTLLDYVSELKSLEISKYTTQVLLDRYKQNVGRPMEPQRLPDYAPLVEKERVKFLTGLDVLGCLGLLAPFAGVAWLFFVSEFFFFGMFTILGGFVLCVRLHCDTRNKEIERVDQENQEIRKELAERQRRKKLYEAEYTQWRIEVELYDDKKSKIVQELTPYVSQLSDTIEKLYDKDIIFPKYRNLVAVSALCEYLLSGRCSSLEGVDGAYNLYEAEIRQNIIIDKLSIITEDIEQIKQNQYILYQDLSSSAAKITNIMNCTEEIENNTALAAYYSELNAQIAQAPSYLSGNMVFKV